METKLKKIIKVISIFLIESIVISICWGFISIEWQSKYDSNNFNCRDMSYTIGRFFKSIGIPTKLVFGSRADGTHIGHCWLQLFGFLEFESTTLFPRFFNKNSDKYTDYIIVDI